MCRYSLQQGAPWSVQSTHLTWLISQTWGLIQNYRVYRLYEPWIMIFKALQQWIRNTLWYHPHVLNKNPGSQIKVLYEATKSSKTRNGAAHDHRLRPICLARPRRSACYCRCFYTRVIDLQASSLHCHCRLHAPGHLQRGTLRCVIGLPAFLQFSCCLWAAKQVLWDQMLLEFKKEESTSCRTALADGGSYT